MTLHIVSAALSIDSLKTVVELSLADDSAILMINDGIYNLAGKRRKLLRAAIEKHRIYVLRDDAFARGIGDETIHLPATYNINYKGFVELTAQHTPIQTWY